jgi:hypothetical protein
MKRFRCIHVCRHNPWACKGAFEFAAGNLEEAVQYARQYLKDSGGLEGLDWEVREA